MTSEKKRNSRNNTNGNNNGRSRKRLKTIIIDMHKNDSIKSINNQINKIKIITNQPGFRDPFTPVLNTLILLKNKKEEIKKLQTNQKISNNNYFKQMDKLTNYMHTIESNKYNSNKFFSNMN